jgi:hypothetical protein
MKANSAGSVSTGEKEDEPCTGSVWVAVFRYVTARSRLARILKLTNRIYFFNFQIFGGRGKEWILESVHKGVRLYR